MEAIVCTAAAAILRRIAAGTVLTLLGATAARAAALPTPSPVATSVATATYVGVQVCAPCHEKAYTAWRGSNHERAMQPATAENVLGDFSGTTFTGKSVRARFFKKGEQFFVHTEGPDGKPADFEVAYTFGVEPLQQYLIRFSGGRLQSFTIAWDTRPKTAGGQRWFDLYPNEKIALGDPLHWTGADQNWNYMCASCHSTNLQKRYDASTDTYATSWTDVDVACEACHGPGSRHVDWAKAQSKDGVAPSGDNGLVVHFPQTQLARWVIDPATASARPGREPGAPTEINACAPCHMRRGVIASGYIPDQPLLDAYLPTLLSEGLYFADGQIQGEVYEYGSFLQSKMYHVGVSCRNCHEPHSLALRAPGNAVCAQCHLPSKYDSTKHHFHAAGSPGASCIGCHMPSTTYMIIDPRHDHSLRVPRPDLSVTLGTPNACTKCHTDRDAVWARDHARAWYGHDPTGYQSFAAALQDGRAGAPPAAAALATLIGTQEQPAIARATALSLLPRYLDPASIPVLERGLHDSDAMVRWAAVGALEPLPLRERLQLATPLLTDRVRLVRLEAARQLAGTSGGADDLPQLQRALEDYVAAQRVDADRPEAHTNLCTLFGERGEIDAALSECRAAIRLRPSYLPAYVNLADLYRALQRDQDGEKVLREGLTQLPDDAALHHALGLLMVRTQRPGAALDELRRAVQLRPEVARYGYVLGIALHSTGKTDRALEVLQQVHARHPADRDVLVALVTINRDSGRTQQARNHARQLVLLAPNDAAARQLLQQLEGVAP